MADPFKNIKKYDFNGFRTDKGGAGLGQPQARASVRDVTTSVAIESDHSGTLATAETEVQLGFARGGYTTGTRNRNGEFSEYAAGELGVGAGLLVSE